jgi:hypothetical protein
MMTARSFSRFFLFTALAAILPASAASAQVLGTFRWRTAPYCNVLNLLVVQNGAVFTLDGFDEQCGGNPRQPVHGIAVPQPNGTVVIGLTVVSLPGPTESVTLQAVVDMGTISGTWHDSAGSTGPFVFSPGGTSGGPRPGPVSSTSPIPSTFALLPDGGFLAGGVLGQGFVPDSGPGARMMWYPKKAAFRAGYVDGPLWDDPNIGVYSASFGRNTAAVGPYAVTFGTDTGAVGTASFAAGASSTAHAILSVAIGDHVNAHGIGSVALGSYATTNTNANGSFVYGDRSGSSTIVSDQPNQFIVRAAGGTRFESSANGSTGVVLLANANAWSVWSDVNMKEHFRDLDDDELLAKIAAMPVREWSYKAQDEGIRHMGPTAQDFWSAFGLGEDPLRISTIDADGVALAAVRALEARTRELMQENEALRKRLDDIEKRLSGGQ